eukprot:TRINITY_DN44321_c0_g1_i1.p1 TRINITY_DN44321_c0_g1~~TRINITY_DN44321_c0_g1_i1.p1  ORF type:complete len:524 (+),score=108.96 TRINITY_DN44321_c0_g1_i1:235-1572(+)
MDAAFKQRQAAACQTASPAAVEVPLPRRRGTLVLAPGLSSPQVATARVIMDLQTPPAGAGAGSAPEVVSTTAPCPAVAHFAPVATAAPAVEADSLPMVANANMPKAAPVATATSQIIPTPLGDVNLPDSSPAASDEPPAKASRKQGEGLAPAPKAAAQPVEDGGNTRMTVLSRLRLEMAHFHVMEEGSLDVDCFQKAVSRLTEEELQPEEFVQVWSSLKVSEEAQAAALELLMAAAARGEDLSLPESIIELVKARRVKLDSFATAFAASVPHDLGEDGDWLASSSDDCTTDSVFAQGMKLVLSRCLLGLFPAGTWGWSRVGWAWVQWWGLVEKCFAGASPGAALSLLSASLSLMQEKVGIDLFSWEPWQPLQRRQRLQKWMLALAALQPELSTSSVWLFLSSLGGPPAGVVDIEDDEEIPSEATWYSQAAEMDVDRMLYIKSKAL